MSFCPNCGKELKENAVFCAECGTAVNPAPQQAYANQAPAQQFQQPAQVQQPMYPQVEEEKKTLATCALAFAFLMPIVGLILGIIGVVKYKTAKYKNQCIAAIPLSIVVWVMLIVLSML